MDKSELIAHYDELGEIIENVWAAVLRGEMTEQDARDYLAAAMKEGES